MSSGARVRVYIACSLDGFIAGKGDDLSWLPGADPTREHHEVEAPAHLPRNEPGSVEYDDFMSGVGALLMGRRTYDVVLGFGGAWPYGERPVLVATNRPLSRAATSVEAVSGSIEQLVERALSKAGGADVYLDGGNLIRQALDAGLVDDLVVTVVPVLLGEGHSLFAGVAGRHRLEFTGHYRFGGSMVQLHARPLARRSVARAPKFVQASAMADTWLTRLAGSTLHGEAELWLDPMGNEVTTSNCTITISEIGFNYTWSHEDKTHRGRFELTEDGGVWTDTWHQPQPMRCNAVASSWSLVDVTGTYSAGEGPDWGWRISLSQRPGGELVLQMTNVTPWGERGRAVRMVATA